MSSSRVLAGAAGVGVVNVTAMGPTIVQTVVLASGSGSHGTALFVAVVVGTGAGAGAGAAVRFCVAKAWVTHC